MQTKLNRLFLMLIFTAFAMSSWALVSNYTFASTIGTYTEISGGTILPNPVSPVVNPTYNAIPLGFDFVYDGVSYNTISVAENAFLAMGNEVATNNLPISSATSTNNVLAALSRDIIARSDGTLMYLLSGTAPNRVFTVQWKNFRRGTTSAANDILNFQIQMHEGSNEIVFCYGNTTAINVPTAATVQVGIRGASNDDFNNRSTSTDWAATEAGTANNNSCRLSDTVFPPTGLTFTYTPVQQGNPPMPAQTPSPAHLATNVSPSTYLSWINGGGAPTGYKVYLGTNNPPTNLVNGSSQAGTTYQPSPALNYSSQYFWRIVPFNADGDAEACPVWSFTTWANPTITTYPYIQGFDTVAPPALPIGWSAANVNADSYTWESIVDANANTAPNAMRIRYNQNLAMNDWLISPPMQVTGEYVYKVKFYYRANSAAHPEKLALFKGNAPNAAALTDQIWVNENIINTAYQMAEVLVPVAADGIIYLGFKGYSDADRYHLFIDSFSVSEMSEMLYPPTNLTSSVSGNDVHLSWEAPVPPLDGEWLSWSNNEVLGNSVGTNAAATFDVAHMYDATDLAAYQGNSLTQVKFVPGFANCVYTIKIWTDGTATTPANLVYSAVASNVVVGEWNTHILTAPVPLPATRLWIGYGVNTQGGHPAGCDDGPQIQGKGNIMNFNGWTTLSQVSATLTFNWLLQGFVTDNVTFRALSPVALAETPTSPNQGVLSLGHFEPTRNSRDLLGYKVYRDGALIHTVSGAATMYNDMNLELGTYSYTVTANYDGGESIAIGPVLATIADLVAPLDLAATVTGNDVSLAWSSPVPPQEGQWISWSNIEALSNSIGTGAAATFDVAHMYDATDLAAYQGGALTQMKFVPGHEACTYTIKVWTGGTATAPGTLVYSAVANNITVGAWNLHILNTPIAIPNTRLWIGYGVNTQGGHPAGTDDGPQIEGKGNMMYFNNAWSTLSQVAPTLTYNFSIQSFVTGNATLKALEPVAIAQNPQSISKGVFSAQRFEPARSLNRALLGYKVYRDATMIANISNPETTTYQDMDLPNGDYVYGVTGIYSEGESVPATVNVNVNLLLAPVLFEDSFETYPDFALLFAPWTLLDVDLSATFGIENFSFPNSESPMAYIIFNPAAVTPPLTGLTAYEGNKMAASFAAVNAPNNDWMIAPRVTLGTNSALKFYAKSHTTNYGLERFRVGVSDLPTVIHQSFQYVSGPTFVEAPANWTEYIYDLSAYDNQSVFIGIRCVSNDAFVFYVDKASIHSVGGFVANDDYTAPVAVTELKGNYPNPFNPETTIRFSVKEASPVSIEIYNVKGQLVKNLLSESKAAGEHNVIWKGTDNNNRPVSSGIYYYKMHAGKYSSTKKMIMMK